LNTFSLAFDYPQFDERKWIETVRNVTNINSYFTIPKEEELIASLRHLLTIQEEPFGSTSIFGQYMVMQLIHSQGIKVTLDGQGSDEMLAGYLGYADSYFADLIYQGDQGELHRQVNIYCEKHKLTPSIAIERAEKLLRTGKLGRFIEVNSKFLHSGFNKRYHHEIVLPKKFPSMLQNQLYQDLTSLSIPAFLRYEDRNAMAFSIESRLPFLDYRLVEFIFSLPAEMKMNNAVTKVILRKAMHGVIPEIIENRQDKMGFVTPESIWFRKGLRPVLEEVFLSKSLAGRDFLNYEAIRQEWEDYKSGKRNDSFTIWRLANLELWMREFVD
jgi:asparagine synthase (glutamine-hydrolysing)